MGLISQSGWNLKTVDDCPGFGMAIGGIPNSGYDAQKVDGDQLWVGMSFDEYGIRPCICV